MGELSDDMEKRFHVKREVRRWRLNSFWLLVPFWIPALVIAVVKGC